MDMTEYLAQPCREEINICTEEKPGFLNILDTKMLQVQLDLSKMKLFATYKRNQYEVHGNCAFGYIVIA